MDKYSLLIQPDNSNKWYPLDVDGVDFNTIYSLTDLYDISKKNDNISENLNLDGTPNNNMLLGHLYDITRYSEQTYIQDLGGAFIANKHIKCQLLVNGVLILNGKLLVQHAPVVNGFVTYESIIIGNVIAFFSNLKGKYLHELQYDSTPIKWDMATVLDSWIGSQSVVFPNIDYGVDERVTIYNTDQVATYVPNHWDDQYDFKNYRPALRVSEYLKAIFRGYNLNTSQVDDIIQDLLIPYSEESFTVPLSGIWNTITLTPFSATLEQIRAVAFPSSLNPNPDYQFTLDSDYFEQVDFVNPIQINGQYTVRNAKGFKTKDRIKAPITVSMNVTINSNQAGNYKIGLARMSDEYQATLDNNSLQYSQTINNNGTQQTYPISIDIAEDTEFDGRFIFMITKDGGNGGVSFSCSNISIQFGKENAISKVDLVYGKEFRIKDVVPRDILVVDFLKSLMTMFNLFLTYDNMKEEFTLNTYSVFYADIINYDYNKAVDWTGKIDFANYKISTNIDIPKSFSYSFTEGNDMMNEFYKIRYNLTYGNRKIQYSNGLVDGSEQTVIFQPTLNLQTSMDSKDMPVLYQSDGFAQGEKKPFQSGLRILYGLGRRAANNGYRKHYRNQLVGTISNQYYYCSMVDKFGNRSLTYDLPKEYFTNDVITDRGATLFDRYHEQQLKELVDSNLIIVEYNMFLNEVDISNLNFRNPIKVLTSNGTAYFKLLEVQYSGVNSLSKVKLQRIVI